MFWKKKTRLEKAQEAGMHAIAQIQDALHHLPLEQWQEKLNELKENAGEVGNLARQAAEKAQQAADLPGKKEAIQGALAGAQKAMGERIHYGREHARETAIETVDEYLPERGSGSKWLWIAIGMMVGAVIALLIAPASGRRSRAMLRDKISQGKHQAEEMGRAAGETVSNAADRVAGAAQETQKAASPDADEAPADDETVADRVRTELGQNAATQELERINVSCSDGIVTLHGPHLSAEEQQKVAEVVRAVPGVREVESKLEQGGTEDGDSKNGKSKNDKAKNK